MSERKKINSSSLLKLVFLAVKLGNAHGESWRDHCKLEQCVSVRDLVLLHLGYVSSILPNTTNLIFLSFFSILNSSSKLNTP
jgi:hypothetical protein